MRQVVRGAPHGDVSYAIRFGEGGVRVLVDGDEGADIEVTSEYATAISKGDLSPAAALTSGELHVRGRVELLARHRDAWDALDDLLAPVRATTDY